MSTYYEEITHELGVEGFALWIEQNAKNKCQFCVYEDDYDSCPSGKCLCKDGIMQWLNTEDGEW